MSPSPELPSSGPVRVQATDGGAIWHAVLATPKANILDMEKIAILSRVFSAAGETAGLKAILIEGEGPHFSFGASVEEHLPEQCGKMIPAIGDLFRRLLGAAVPTLAVVRGQCLGGGLELASFCHRLFASPDAKLGQPEIVLGVFAPIASVILTERIGRSRAEDLCLSGRSLDAAEALRVGLVDEVAEDPLAAAREYASKYLLPRSATSLRHAVRAVRAGFAKRFTAELAALEHAYLDELMATHDAAEGIKSFIEKRSPQWKNA